MKNINIQTEQYVNISVPLASPGERILARCIDYAVIAAFFFAGTLLSLKYINDNNLQTLVLFIILLPSAFYSVICELFYNGRTIGKAICHTRVISADGSQLTAGQTLLRWIFLIVDVWFSTIGLLPVLATKRHQRLGDMAAGTVVISDRKEPLWQSSLDSVSWLRKDYKPVYPQAQRLSAGQADLISRALDTSYGSEQIELLAGKVSEFLNIKQEKNAALFLRDILHDYQYYTFDAV